MLCLLVCRPQQLLYTWCKENSIGTGVYWTTIYLNGACHPDHSRSLQASRALNSTVNRNEGISLILLFWPQSSVKRIRSFPNIHWRFILFFSFVSSTPSNSTEFHSWEIRKSWMIFFSVAWRYQTIYLNKPFSKGHGQVTQNLPAVSVFN